MRKFLSEKPWYFASVFLGFFATSIFEQIVAYYFGEEKIAAILNRSFRIADVLPWGMAGIVFFICLGVYIYQLQQHKKMDVSSHDMDNLNSILEKTINDNEYIESIQAFQFWPKNDSKWKYIKLCYLAGVANERIEINTILQTYYYFTYSMYKKIKTVSANYDDYISENDPVKKDYAKTAFLNNGKELCESLLNSLNSIQSVDEIGDFHCEMYRVLARILPAISDEAIESFLRNQEVEIALIKRKKTGILGAVILDDLYIFRNQNSLAKRDRIYFTFPYDKKRNIILLAAINGSCFPSDEEGTIEAYCKRVVSSACV